MNNNGVVEEKEPKVVSQFIPIGIMLPPQQSEAIKEETSSNGSRGFAAVVLLAAAWWILYGWRLFQ